LFLVILSVTVYTVSSSALLYTETEYQHEFTKWVSLHEKRYDIEEFFSRYSIFKDNLNFIGQHNSLNKSFTLGLNQFADLTLNEFQKIFTMEQRPRPSEDLSLNLTQKYKNVNFASDYDWRTHGYVTAMKNQGQCGSCYAFATISTVETLWAIKMNILYGLSEQQIIDCSSNNGCVNGFVETAYQYLISNGGVASQVAYPYTGVKGQCNSGTIPSYGGVRISSYQTLPQDENALLSYAAQTTVAVLINTDTRSFQFYSTGVYDDPDSIRPYNHAVVVVGWGVSYGAPYWTLRNSWGTTWGEHGYIRVVRGKNMCNISFSPMIPVI